VLESPVRSGLLPKSGKTETETGSDQLMDRKRPHKTDIDRFSAVMVGFQQSKTGFGPVHKLFNM
jgi:hypothetical protein